MMLQVLRQMTLALQVQSTRVFLTDKRTVKSEQPKITFLWTMLQNYFTKILISFLIAINASTSNTIVLLLSVFNGHFIFIFFFFLFFIFLFFIFSLLRYILKTLKTRFIWKVAMQQLKASGFKLKFYIFYINSKLNNFYIDRFVLTRQS